MNLWKILKLNGEKERERIPENKRTGDLHIDGNTKRSATQSINEKEYNFNIKFNNAVIMYNRYVPINRTDS